MSESEESAMPNLLSDILTAQGGRLLPGELRKMSAYAAELANKDAQTVGEADWLQDFTRYIGIAVAAQNTGESEWRSARVAPVNTEETRDAHFYEALGDSEQTSRHRLPNIKMNELVRKPEGFLGVRSRARSWLEEFEAAAEDNNWSEAVTVKYFPAFLKEAARTWYDTLVKPQLVAEATWAQLRAIFVRYYMGPAELDAVRDELRRTRQRRDEPATSFIPRVIRLVRLAYPSLTESEQVREVKAKLQDIYLEKMIGHKADSLVELNDLCLEIERRFRIGEGPNKKPEDNREQRRNERGEEERKRSGRRRRTRTSTTREKKKPECVFAKRSAMKRPNVGRNTASPKTRPVPTRRNQQPQDAQQQSKPTRPRSRRK